MRRIGVRLALDNQTYIYTTLQDLDTAIANQQAVIDQRLRRIARDQEVLRRMRVGREDLAKQIQEKGQQQAARNRSKRDGQ